MDSRKRQTVTVPPPKAGDFLFLVNPTEPSIILLLSPMTFATSADTDPTEPIPSYRGALEAFRAELTKAGGTLFGAEDKPIMARAARDLADEMPNPGLSVGEKASDFELPNTFGRQVRLSDLLADGPGVLTFCRSAWCPYCNLQLRGLRKTLPHIQGQGARLVAITPQQPDKSRRQVEKDGYLFEILSDLDDRAMQDYRLYIEVPADLSEVYKQKLSLGLGEYNSEGRCALPVPQPSSSTRMQWSGPRLPAWIAVSAWSQPKSPRP